MLIISIKVTLSDILICSAIITQLILNMVTYTCRTTVIFGTLEDDGLQINSLASTTETSSKMASTVKCFKQKHVFLSKSSKFGVVWTYDFVQVSLARGTCFFFFFKRKA